MAASTDRDRFDALAPRDVVATLRSLERRFGAVMTRASDPQLSDVIDRPGPSGRSLDAVVTETASGGSLVASALDVALDATDPVVAEAVLDPSERVFTDERVWSIDASVDTIVADAQRAAERIDRATADALSRVVAVTGAGSTRPLAISQQLARELIGALSTCERHVEWLEGQA